MRVETDFIGSRILFALLAGSFLNSAIGRRLPSRPTW